MSSSTLHHAGKKRKVVNVILLDGSQSQISVDVSVGFIKSFAKYMCNTSGKQHV